MEDFSLEVPAGAFGSESELKLYTFTDEFPAEGGASTGLFRVSGLPNDFQMPLTVRLRVTENSDDAAEALLLLGSDVFVKTLQDDSASWSPLEAELSDGFLSAVLPALPSGRDSERDFEYFDLPLGGTFYYSSLESGPGHFKIYYPTGMQAPADNLADYLETAYTVFSGMGFSYAARDRWPVRAIVQALPSGRSGEAVPSIWGDNYSSLRFSTSQLPNADVMRVTAGHEFFHIIQAFYDPRGDYAKATEASPHLWLDEASAVWAEELFAGGVNYSSSSRNGLLMEPFEGLQAGLDGNAGWHGYGMSALIKYLVSKNGDVVLRSIYDQIVAGAHPIVAIKSVQGDFDGWLNDFFLEYFSGVLYGSDEIPFMIAGNVGEWSIDAPDDTLKTFTKHDPALSACLFKIVLDNEDFSPLTRAEITLEGDGPAMINVFKYNNSTGATLLDSGEETVVVENLKDLMDDNHWIIVMVTAMHEDAPHFIATEEHETTIQLREEGILDVLKRSQGIFYEARIDGGTHTFMYTSPDTTYFIVDQNNLPDGSATMIPGDIFDGPWPALSISGRYFTSYISYSTGTGTWDWGMSGTFSADGRVLQNVSVFGEGNFAGNNTITWGFNLHNLAFVCCDDFDEDSCSFRWRSLGSGYISDLNYHQSFNVPLEDGSIGVAVIDYFDSNWIYPVAEFSFSQH